MPVFPGFFEIIRVVILNNIKDVCTICMILNMEMVKIACTSMPLMMHGAPASHSIRPSPPDRPIYNTDRALFNLALA